jgi:hypothetical protein
VQYISLNNSSLTYFTSKGSLTELSGSSKFNVIDNQIVIKEKSTNGRIENRAATLDYLNNVIHDDLSDNVIDRMIWNYVLLWAICKREKFTSESKLNRLELLERIILKALVCSNEFAIKSEIVHKSIEEQNCRYKTTKRIKSTHRVINKTKVKGKMFALFNLKCSRKFMAFYSVSFPTGTTDNQAFECLNYWLTKLRKSFDLQNYIWVTERQKNGTIHYHMLTNNYMPILQINRAMAIIIDNKVLENKMSWGGSSRDRYNGVDVDSIFNSKRHKKTGKMLNPSEVRNWLVKYITKYVTKNTEKFEHLCWHCSRSVSILFLSTLYIIHEARKVTDFLPRLRDKYINYHSEHNDTWVFKFVPPEKIFEKIRLYNDLIFGEFVPSPYKAKSIINYKTITL